MTAPLLPQGEFAFARARVGRTPVTVAEGLLTLRKRVLLCRPPLPTRNRVPQPVRGGVKTCQVNTSVPRPSRLVSLFLLLCSWGRGCGVPMSTRCCTRIKKADDCLIIMRSTAYEHDAHRCHGLIHQGIECGRVPIAEVHHA